MSVTWDFGDGTTLTDEAQTSHTYADEGTYTVSARKGDRTGSVEVAVPSDVVPPLTPTRLYLVANAYVRTDHNRPLDTPDGVDIRMKLALADWSANNGQIVRRAASASTGISWMLRSQATRRLSLQANGESIVDSHTSDSHAALAGETLCVRVTRGGTGNMATTWYRSDDDGATWTQWGSAGSGEAIGPIYAGNERVHIGSRSGSAMWVEWLEVRHGIDGPIVTSPDFRTLRPGDTSLTDAQGIVYTLHTGAVIEEVANE